MLAPRRARLLHIEAEDLEVQQLYDASEASEVRAANTALVGGETRGL